MAAYVLSHSHPRGFYLGHKCQQPYMFSIFSLSTTMIIESNHGQYMVKPSTSDFSRVVGLLHMTAYLHFHSNLKSGPVF